MFTRSMVFVVFALVMCNFGYAQIETKWVISPDPEELDFSDVNNWTLGVPGIDDTAIFDTDTPFKVNMDVDGEIDRLEHVSGALTLLGPGTLAVTNDIDLDTEVNLAADAHLTGEEFLVVGDNSMGSMVASGGSILDFQDDIVLGDGSNAIGELTLLGASTTMSDFMVVGRIGEGCLTIGSSSVSTSRIFIAGFAAGSDGFVKVDASSARLESTMNAIIGQFGRGIVELNNGACMDVSNGLFCGLEPGGEGAVIITGNSDLDAGRICLGQEGDGAIGVGDGDVCCGVVDIGVEPGSMGGIVVAENGQFLCTQLNAGIEGGCEILIRESGSINVEGTVILNEDAMICFQDSPDFGLLSTDGGVIAEGLIKFESGTGHIVGNVTLQGDGELEFNEGRGIIFGNLTHNGDEIFVAPQTEFVVDGNYSGSGPMDGGGLATFLGEINPGSAGSTAVVDWDIDVDFTSSSELRIELGGTGIGQYDRLNIDDSLDVQGCELTVSMTNGFVPEAGDRFVIADVGGNLTGFFAGLESQVSEFTSVEGFEFLLSYDTQADEIELIALANVVLLGDVNMDGIVNLLDVGPFINALTTGTFILEADIDQNGSVDLLDVGPFVDILTN